MRLYSRLSKQVSFLFFALLFFSSITLAQDLKDLSYYFPNQKFDSSIPTPQSVIGFVPGEWHVSHDRLVKYMEALAAASPRMTIGEYAKSHEGRKLVVLTVTSEENQGNINELKRKHVAYAYGKNSNLEGVPTVLYQGYSVHGNESSGANAALLYAYFLAAAQGPEIDALLKEQIVLLDPCYNPDGLHRFSTWANMHKGRNPSTDPVSREFNEVWPGGRTNHYWFDLNRDWLLLVHPESRGRIATFHDWKPNVLTDHHEMGSNSTFFFQPGIPSRTNPLTPQKNQDLTQAIAEYHAVALDKIGSQYFSKENFDDFYYGKGSTYPDVNGCVGILFEQASSRGHLRSTQNGLLSFPFTIRNQLVTSISTLKAGAGLRKELLRYQNDFYKNRIHASKSGATKGFLVTAKKDVARLVEFVHVLEQHQIDAVSLDQRQTANGRIFKSAESIYVSLDQMQNGLIQAIFETQTSFADSLFYDVSAWNLAMAYGLEYEAVTKEITGKSAPKTLSSKGRIAKLSNYGYFLDWRDYHAAQTLYKIQGHGLRTRLLHEDVQAKVEGKLREFPRGTIFIPVQNQNRSTAEILNIINGLTSTGAKFYGIDSGLTANGIDLGSPKIRTLKRPKALMIIGDGIVGYDAGEVWHQFDMRYEIPLTMVEGKDFSKVDLNKYSVIILPDGAPRGINNGQIEKLKDWVQHGGTIIGVQRAAGWLKRQGMAKLVEKNSSDETDTIPRPYDVVGQENGVKFIGGAIFNNSLDLTHPLCYGYTVDEIPVFHQGTTFYQTPKSPYAAPLRYTKNPLLAGYISKDNLKEISNSIGVLCSAMGRGKVITFSFNPLFRGYWLGTERLFRNAVFFGDQISGNSCER